MPRRRHLPKEGVDKRSVFRQQFGSEADGERVLAQVREAALESGLHFSLSGQRAGNSEDAHRLVLAAASSGSHTAVLRDVGRPGVGAVFREKREGCCE